MKKIGDILVSSQKRMTEERMASFLAESTLRRASLLNELNKLWKMDPKRPELVFAYATNESRQHFYDVVAEITSLPVSTETRPSRVRRDCNNIVVVKNPLGILRTRKPRQPDVNPRKLSAEALEKYISKICAKLIKGNQRIKSSIVNYHSKRMQMAKADSKVLAQAPYRDNRAKSLTSPKPTATPSVQAKIHVSPSRTIAKVDINSSALFNRDSRPSNSNLRPGPSRKDKTVASLNQSMSITRERHLREKKMSMMQQEKSPKLSINGTQLDMRLDAYHPSLQLIGDSQKIASMINKAIVFLKTQPNLLQTTTNTEESQPKFVKEVIGTNISSKTPTIKQTMQSEGRTEFGTIAGSVVIRKKNAQELRNSKQARIAAQTQASWSTKLKIRQSNEDFPKPRIKAIDLSCLLPSLESSEKIKTKSEYSTTVFNFSQGPDRDRMTASHYVKS